MSCRSRFSTFGVLVGGVVVDREVDADVAVTVWQTWWR